MEIKLDKEEILEQIRYCDQYLDSEFFYDAIIMGASDYNDEVELFKKLYERLIELDLIGQNMFKKQDNE